MGTNYYWHRNPCTSCGHPEEVAHIGKSSGGWAFALHVNFTLQSGRAVNDLHDWKHLFQAPGSRIVDEYDRIVSAKEMVLIITDRKAEPITTPPVGYSSIESFCLCNVAVIGQQNLLFPRAAYAPPQATWYHAVGDFS